VKSERCKKKESIVMRKKIQAALEVCSKRKIKRRQPAVKMRKKLYHIRYSRLNITSS
jgi:hypothetical protein